jgi:purine-binding chemotaxis protein CheW
MSYVQNSSESLSQNGHSTAARYLTFAIAHERYGFEIARVQEIIQVSQITRVPKASTAVKGVINLRGKIIPVVDLRLRFAIDEAAYNNRTCVIVIEMMWQEERIAVGVIVDTVLEVLDFTPDRVETSPNFGCQVDSKFLTGIAEHDGHANLLLDIEKVIASTIPSAALAEIK